MQVAASVVLTPFACWKYCSWRGMLSGLEGRGKPGPHTWCCQRGQRADISPFLLLSASATSLSPLSFSRPFDPSRIRDREEDICRLIHPVCIVFYLQLLLVYDHRSSINPCSDMFMQWITRLISTSRTRRQVERRRGPRKVSF